LTEANGLIKVWRWTWSGQCAELVEDFEPQRGMLEKIIAFSSVRLCGILTH